MFTHYNFSMDNSKRLIAIGDIHGEIEKLKELLNQLAPQKDDTLVFLGDYIDRGLNSKEVINCLIELSKKTNCIFLKGNHEDLLLKVLQTRNEIDILNWLIAGGRTTLDNYGSLENIFKLHNDFFNNLKPYYITKDYLFVHAGINPNKLLEEQDEYDLLWIRDNFIYRKHKLKQKIVFGHTPFTEPYFDDNKIGINTCCGNEADDYITALVCGEEYFITSEL